MPEPRPNPLSTQRYPVEDVLDWDIPHYNTVRQTVTDTADTDGNINFDLPEERYWTISVEEGHFVCRCYEY